MGLDILPVSTLPQSNVVTLCKDVRETDITELCAIHAPGGFSGITCDIAPNLSGIREVDNKNVGDLYGAVRSAVIQGLKTGGNFVVKAFFSDDFKATKADLVRLFRSVSVFKPAASRSVSSEIYLVALGKK